MKYLILPNSIQARGRNHAAYCAWRPLGIPQSSHDTLYRWNMLIHPTDGRAALAIPDEEATTDMLDEEGNTITGNLTTDEHAALVDALDETWTPTEAI
jgi:hypothetical protein